MRCDGLEISVTQGLPVNGAIVLCYGYKTVCCEEDMDEEPDWHVVQFKIELVEYKLKKDVPKVKEESVFEYCKVHELWRIVRSEGIENEKVIGVTKWKQIR